MTPEPTEMDEDYTVLTQEGCAPSAGGFRVNDRVVHNLLMFLRAFPVAPHCLVRVFSTGGHLGLT